MFNKRLRAQIEEANAQIETKDSIFNAVIAMCENIAKENETLKQKLLEVTAERDALQKSVARIMRPVEVIQPRGITE